ncbi:MAG TPA: SUMF1/EgtB/PvdO family nonheme iron enzyme [Thermoanaerobaculia bacterium]
MRRAVRCIVLLLIAACATTPAIDISNPRAKKMIRFEGGTLHPAGHADEVDVAPFLIDVTEVTTSEYRECVRSGACAEAAKGPACTYFDEGAGRLPINCVTWEHAVDYCKWLDKRLPTEAEWEWAARGGTAARKFPWGDAMPVNQLCWNGAGNPLGKGQRRGPCPIGSYPKGNTPEGLVDMGGNVQEWTSNVWKVGGRIVRGGGWTHEDFDDLLTTRRATYNAAKADASIGFRCAKSP